MRVLHINVCGGLSTGRIACGLAGALSAHGHESVVAFARGSAPRDVASYQIGEPVTIRLHALAARLTDRAGFFSAVATRRLISYIRDYDPDIIHLHNLHGYYLHVGILFDYLRESFRGRVVWTLHDCWSVTGHCTHFINADCDRWMTGCYDCPQKGEYPTSWLVDSSARNYAEKKLLFNGLQRLILITPSEWLAGIIRRSFFAEHDIRVINNGIDTNVFRPTENGLTTHTGSGKRMILGVASTWSERKGLADFYRLRELLDDSWEITLVGLKESQIADLPSGITGITRTENTADLALLYSAAEVFVNPTYEDNFPTVNLEALACGTPVVTYNTGGSGECLGFENSSLECGKQYVSAPSGAAVAVGNVYALAEAITNGGYSREVCLERSQLYTQELSVSRYMDIYMDEKAVY